MQELLYFYWDMKYRDATGPTSQIILSFVQGKGPPLMMPSGSSSHNKPGEWSAHVRLSELHLSELPPEKPRYFLRV